MLDKPDKLFYYPDRMSKTSDKKLVKRFIEECASRGLTLEQMGAAVGKTKSWAGMLVNGQIKRPYWRTRNLIRQFLGEI